MKIGIHNSYANKDWQADYTDIIKRVSRVGFDVLEANPGKFMEMPAQQRQDLKKLAADESVELTFSFGLPPQYDLSCEDGSVRRAGIAYMKDIIKVVAEMGGSMVGGCIYSYWPFNYTGRIPDRETLLDHSVASVCEVVKTAEDCGVDYAVEVLNRFEQYLLNTAQEGVDYVKRIGSPRAKLLMDTFHMNIEEDSFEDAFITAGEYMVDIHMDENNRKFPGMGILPWDKMLSALKKINYQGYIVMEPFMITGGEVGRNVYLWRDLTNGATQQQLDDMAAESIRYLRALGY